MRPVAAILDSTRRRSHLRSVYKKPQNRLQPSDVTVTLVLSSQSHWALGLQAQSSSCSNTRTPSHKTQEAREEKTCFLAKMDPDVHLQENSLPKGC